MKWRVIPVTLVLGLALLAVPVTAYADPTGPRIPGPRFSTSTNWGGYASLTSLTSPQPGSVSYVVGTWQVTPVNATAVNAYSASWVGIDGYASGTVEQLGTESDWVNGGPVYSVWYEMYPKRSMNVPMAVKPGDIINASVAYTKSGFTLSIVNMTTGATFSTTQKSGSARRMSAEWILEPPYAGGVLPLANVGTVPFSACQAIINGHLGPIDDATWVYDPITIVSKAGNTVAVPSSLKDSQDASAFSVKWLSAN